MNRTRFYQIVINNSINELDYLNNTLSNFDLRYDVTYYRVNEHESCRPDLISYTFYNTPMYWWVILLINGILDPFTELIEGVVLEIPSILDIYEFYRNNRLR